MVRFLHKWNMYTVTVCMHKNIPALIQDWSYSDYVNVDYHNQINISFFKDTNETVLCLVKILKTL